MAEPDDSENSYDKDIMDVGDKIHIIEHRYFKTNRWVGLTDRSQTKFVKQSSK